MPQLSPTAKSLLTLLNNVNDLIVEASDRDSARDTMHAIDIFARNKQFPIPHDKIQNFLSVLLDSKPYTLTTLIMDIAEDIVVVDSKI